MRKQPGYPYVSAAVWGLGVFVLVLVNSGSLVLAALLAAVVAFISWRISAAGRDHGA